MQEILAIVRFLQYNKLIVYTIYTMRLCCVS